AEARVVTSAQEMSLDTFHVLDAGVDFVAPERRAQTVAAALGEALAQPSLHPGAPQRLVPRQLRHFRIPIQIDFRIEEPSSRTTMMLVCTDRPGLLARVAALLREHGLRLHDARIATFGERVEDFFQLSDENNHAITDAARLEAVRGSLLDLLDDAP